MDLASQKVKAMRFLRLHKGPGILVLPNAWDAASARIFEKTGFRAIGTTSAGIAASLGLPDKQRVTRDDMLAVVRRIAAAVQVPVTADLEAGYGDSPEQVAATARGAMEAGAVGMNLEDAANDAALYDIALQVERIKAAREAAASMGIAFVLNARTDVFLKTTGDDLAGRFDEALRRLIAYRDAGAACLFLPGVRDPHLIARMVRELAAPLNVLAGPGVPRARDLENMGVARVSTGSGPMRACMGLTHRIAQELMEKGTYAGFTEGALPYSDLNLMMAAGGS